MTTSRRDFLSNVAMTGLAASAATSAIGFARGADKSPAGRPQAGERPHGGVHSVLEKDHPYIFIDSCMQMWPDADFTNAHRHGVTAYAVTAWDPHVGLEAALEGLMFCVRRLTNHPALDVNPEWSPDGTQIAFESDRDGDREIWLVNADGSGLRQLTSNTATDGGPDWSPDGSRIAFQSDRSGHFDIWTMTSAGGDPRNLTNQSGMDGGPSWLPAKTKP